MAAALQRSIQQRGYTLETQQDAAELKIRAERRAGELLQEAEKDHGGRPRKNLYHDGTGFRLPDLGIDRHKSSRWQQIAGLSAEDFEGYVRRVN